MKTLFTISCVMAFAVTMALAQKTSPAAVAEGSEAVGKIAEFTAGASIAINTEKGDAVRYKLGKGVTYMNARGKVVKAGKMKKDRKVRVHYVKEGSDMVVDKVTVVKD